MYLKAAAVAARQPGTWIEVRVFETEANAAVTASCLRRGFLRVRPRAGDESVQIGARTYVALPAALEAEVERTDTGWRLRARTRRS